MGKKLLLLPVWFFIFLPISIWGQECPSSVSISADTGNTICEGTNVTFTASTNNGTAPFTFQWKINGTDVNSATANTFSTSSLTNGQKISVVVTDANGTSCSITSSNYTMTVNSNKTPTVSLSSTPSTKCIGTSVTFTASNTNGGSNPSYAWYVNSSSIPAQTSSSNTFSISNLAAGANSVRVVLTSSLTCVTSSTAESTANITITDNATISSPGNKDQSDVCINTAIDPIVFAIGGSGTGASVTGLPTGVTGNYSSGNFTVSGSPSVDGSFNYTVTATGPCGSVTETGTITILKNATIGLTSANNQQEVCQNEGIANITYDIGETGTGASINGLPNGISGDFAGGVYTISGSSSVIGTHNYSITATGSCGDSQSLNGSITINENLTPSVSITSSDTDNTICEGTQVTFTATSTNGGVSPSYQWKIGTTNVGTNSNTFTTNALALGNQSVSVELTSNETCLTQAIATSNSIVTIVNENLTPEVSISASDSDICPGDEVTFTATPINGGSLASYQWKVDGNNIGTNSPTFVTSNIQDGQSVSVILSSNETCLANNNIESNSITMEVFPPAPDTPGTISGNTEVCSTTTGLIYSVSPVQNADSYNWSFPAGWNITSGAGTSSVTVNAGSSSGNITVTATNTCGDSSSSNNLAVTSVNGVPSNPGTITSSIPANNKTVCPPYDLSFSVAGSGKHKWTLPTGWDILSGAGTNNISVRITDASPSNTYDVSVVAQNICGDSGSSVFTGITVDNHIVANFGPDITICKSQNSVQITGNRSFGDASLNVQFSSSSSGSSGFSSSTAGGNNKNGPFTVIYTPSQADKNNGQVTLTMNVPAPNGKDNDGNRCGASSDSMVLYFTPNATISDPANKDQTVCINTALNNIIFNIGGGGTGASVSGLPPGLSGSFNAGVFTISGTPSQAGTYPYTVSTTGTCTAQQISRAGTITVTPNNTITDASNKDQTVCINQQLINMEFPVNSTVTSVNSTGLPTGITGSISNGKFILSGSPTQAGTFAYSLTTAGTCQTATTTGTIIVNPDVTISSPANSDQSLCINTAIDNIEFTITSPGTHATVTGLPEGLDTSFSNGILTISGIPTEAGAVAGENGVFNYTVQTEGGCLQTSESGTITVIPDPTATISYPEDICTSIAGSVNVNLEGTGDFTGGNFSATPVGLTISASSGAITPASSEPGTYTVSYNGPDTCKPAVATFEVTIIAEPFVEISYEDPFCNSDSVLKDPIFTNGVGDYENGTFSSSEPGGLTIDPENGKINPQTSSPGTYDVYYTIGEGSGCNEVLVTTEVIITQTPQINISYPETICSSETSIPVNISGEDGNYEGGVYSGTGGLSISTDGTINATESTTGPHTVTYIIASDAGCAEVIATANFTIKEAPLITTDPVNTGVCSNNPAEFEVIATGDDLIYQWYRIVDGTTESIPGEDEPILSFTNVTSADALQYFVTVTGDNACTEVTSETVTLNVDEDIVITEPTEDIIICEDQEEQVTFLFKGHANGAPLTFEWIKDGQVVTEVTNKIEMNVSEPSGPNGEYTGTLTIIDPESGETGDSGVYWVTVDGPDYFTCPEATSKTFTFRVDPRPEAPSVTSQQFCLDVNAGNLTAAGEDGNDIKWYTLEGDTYTYIGDNISIDTSSPNTFEYYATQTRPNGCESDFSEKLTIEILDTPPPVSSEIIKFEYCHNEEVLESLAVTPAEGAEINWYNTADAENPLTSPPLPATDVVGTTTYYVSQTFTATTGCESDITPVEVTIKAIPNVVVDIVGEENTICLGSSIDLTATGADTYTWFLGETELQTGTTAAYQATPTTLGENIYTVVGTTKGCTNSYNISVFVDDTSVAGNLNAPERICVSSGTATLSLESRVGEIIKWEYKNATTADAWTETEDIDLNDSRTFTSLTETTSYRVTVKSGVCSEDTAEATVIVDQLPVGGELLWESNSERLFLTCENPADGFGTDLVLSGHTGEVAYWEYRNAPSNTWIRIETNETFLESTQIESVINNLSTTFRAVLSNGSCTDGVYSETAITSVIVADIKPTPVEVDKEVICIGDQISLTSETGYSSEGGKFTGGAFDNAGIKKNGWDFTNPNGGSNDFDSAANNGRADHWLRMNPHGSNPANEKVYTANITNPSTGSLVNFRTYSGSEGNKGFGLVTGDNDSHMETPVFSLGGLDEAILTWDQAYNLTDGATIIVEISTDGGNTYPVTNVNQPIDFSNPKILYYNIGDGTVATGSSGNYDHFGEGTPDINQMSIDLGDYLGMSNLRIRFTYIGTIDGDVWAVDNIEVPEGPQDILLQWYYDEDLNDPDNELEEIGVVNQYTVNFIPRKIGWNDFEVQTRIILDSNGDACQSIDNFETIRVWAFDRYTTTVTSEVGACGSLTVKLDASVSAEYQAKTITEYPTLDGYEGSWRVEDLDGNEVTTGFTITNQDSSTGLDPKKDPNAIFTAENLGDYNFKWVLTPTAVDENDNLIDNSGCPPIENPSNINLVDCTTLDFDGDDDYIDLGTAAYTGSYFIEAWIRPFDREINGSSRTDASKGTIISGPGFEIKMEDLPSSVTPNTRWYHIAVSNGGNIWVDGVPISETATGKGGVRTLIGARWNTDDKTTENHFSGWIEEVRIWNTAPDLKELRFMMNQRIKLNNTASTGSLIEGEVVPNLEIPDGISSYYTDGTHNLDQDGDRFYNQTWGDLAGYYRLISDEPDPLNLTECATFDDSLKPIGGYTPDHSINKIPGRLVNITTNQENTSPTPYCSGSDATWAQSSTWARPDVWDYPNSTYNGTALEWNIARINHNITSDSKEITMLGLLSETEGALLSINGNHAIRITHYLLLDGNMDLVDESQLLQDHGSILANSSKGWAEIDQQGRMSSFNYNYWTSPFSNQGTDNNSGFILNKVLFDGSDVSIDEPPVNFEPGYFSADGNKTNPITISDEWIWDFRGGKNDTYADWLHLGSAYLEIVGAGYSMKGTTGNASLTDTQNYVFRGKPNNGNIPTAFLDVAEGNDYLIGNPFPSAIDADKFIRDNLVNVGTGSGSNENNENVFNGTIYYWDHFAGATHILAEYVGGYASYNLSGSAEAISNDWRINVTDDENTGVLPKQYIPVAQGFYITAAPVAGKTFGGDIIFKNTQRVFAKESTHPSIFLQHEEDIVKGKNQSKGKIAEDNRIKIRVKFESPMKYYRQLLVTMDQNTTNGFDLGYDAPLIENNMEDMYWYFDEKPYVIQGVPDFEKEQILPLAIKSKEGGEFTIKIDTTENWPSGKELYLKDKVLDSIHDILTESYIGTAETGGEINDRFEIVFFKEKSQDPTLPDPDDILNPDLPVIDGLVGISYSTFSKQVKISNFDMLDVSKVMIFDMGGKLIQQYDEIPTQREILLGMRPVRSGVYIIKVFSENGISDKKVVIK
ncbi:T9SS type A sorting domain-containing protein [Christiangramia sediminis]|uniref:T9SS type A sorting domain-containing protein n=1 Tax=Christiangramia sediminis TaxID=2881336 RepID=A0A9X1LJH7_9FLAO|nr:T9SS type A sorting domain-containing protein [Christiangramia sediminis]MCB7481455.1 T9SS type A sorting domain-containing protein [Christiangramia sediminis]